jgi:hypothetical protein
MTINGPATAARASSATAVPRPVSASQPWLYGGLLLAVAAQLITVSALTSADPTAASWPALLLATAPAPLAAAAAFSRAPVNRLLLAAAMVAIIVGGAGQILQTGLFFLPALVVLAVAAVRLWR